MLSICICTFNRADSLAITLGSLKAALAGLHAIEIVIVDNNSSDDTALTIERYARCLPIRYQFEGRQGLSIARNTAVLASNDGLVLFTDDDTLWSKDSIHALLAEADRHPEAGFFDGRILPHWPNGPPSWLHDPTLDQITSLLVHSDRGDESRAIKSGDRVPYGANFAVRRQTLSNIGQFDEALGAISYRRRRGEDTDFLQRAVKLGYTGWYSADAQCMHRLDPDNLKLSRLFQLGVEKGRSAELPQSSPVEYLCMQVNLAVRASAQLLKGRGDRFRQTLINIGITHGSVRQHHD